MANRKRNIQVKFYVTAEEKELMEQKMAQLKTKRIGAYLRKMAIDGYIIYVDTRDISRGFSQYEIPPCYHLLSAVWKSVCFREKDGIYAAWTPRREKSMGGDLSADCE